MKVCITCRVLTLDYYRFQLKFKVRYRTVNIVDAGFVIPCVRKGRRSQSATPRFSGQGWTSPVSRTDLVKLVLIFLEGDKWLCLLYSSCWWEPLVWRPEVCLQQYVRNIITIYMMFYCMSPVSSCLSAEQRAFRVCSLNTKTVISVYAKLFSHH